MSAREEILGRARRALADVTDPDPARDVPIVRPAPATGPATPADVLRLVST